MGEDGSPRARPRRSARLLAALPRQLLLPAALLLLVTTTVPAAMARPPDVLFFVADDLNLNIGAYPGHEFMHTPNMDALAASATVFRQHYVQQAVCGPTRASFLVGRRPDTLRTVTHAVPTYWRERAGPYTSLPQFFKQHGYYTASFGKVFDFRTSSANLTSAGVCDPPSWSQPPEICGADSWNENSFAQGRSHMVLTPEQEASISDTLIVDAAVRFLRTTNVSQPLFLAVGVHRPHLPETVPRRHVDLYPLDKVPMPPAAQRYVPANMPPVATACAGEGRQCAPGFGSFEMVEQYKFNSTHKESNIPAWFGWTGAINSTMPEDMAHTLRQFYFAGVSHTDELFGRVMAALNQTGRLNNTVVAILGDHGWHLDTKGLWCKCTNFEEALAAPFILRVPGHAGQLTDSISEHVDIFPTLVEAAGLPPLPTCPPNSTMATCTEGMSLMPIVSGTAAGVKKAAYSMWPRWPEQSPDLMGFSVRTPDFRYTEWVAMSYSSNGTFVPDWSRLCARELYDEQKDPHETANVAEEADYQQAREVMRGRLHAGWRAAAGIGPWPTLPSQGPPAPNMPCFGHFIPQ